MGGHMPSRQPPNDKQREKSLPSPKGYQCITKRSTTQPSDARKLAPVCAPLCVAYMKVVTVEELLKDVHPKEFRKIPQHYDLAHGVAFKFHDELAKLVVDLESTGALRSEEHTSELQSRGHLVCRLLLEKQNNIQIQHA